jgi:hypothetical protein
MSRYTKRFLTEDTKVYPDRIVVRGCAITHNFNCKRYTLTDIHVKDYSEYCVCTIEGTVIFKIKIYGYLSGNGCTEILTETDFVTRKLGYQDGIELVDMIEAYNKK